jgi:hypothetical protein
MALNKLLLPTFGRPTIATVGNAISYLSIINPENGIITDLCPGKKGQITRISQLKNKRLSILQQMALFYRK